MQFCAKCFQLSVLYVHALKQAVCTNPDCKLIYGFDSYELCKQVLGDACKEHCDELNLVVVPWSPKPEEVSILTDNQESVTMLALQIHKVFINAGIQRGLIPADELALSLEDDEALKGAVYDLSKFIYMNYVRKDQ